MTTPSMPQMQHLFRLIDQGKITRANLQAYLEDPNRFIDSFTATVDNTIGLIQLIETAVGPNNLGNINRDITPERFKLGEGVRKVNLELAAFLDGETGKQAAKRLVADGYTLEGTGELAQFLADNPEEVEKYGWVVALNEASRWTCPDGSVLVPCTYVRGVRRGFNLGFFHHEFESNNRVLVSRPSK